MRVFRRVIHRWPGRRYLELPPFPNRCRIQEMCCPTHCPMRWLTRLAGLLHRTIWMTIEQGVAPRVLVADPNPPSAPLRVPPPVRATVMTPEGEVPQAATASFTIDYIANGGADLWSEPCYTFPESAKASFNAAAAIWADLLQSSVPIAIRACWASFSGSTLGYSGGGYLYRDFPGAPLAGTYYSASLANALSGSDRDSTTYDMHITYNGSFSWYYGVDGNTPSGQHDLMSVVLHEIAHGLNFSGSMRYAVGNGSWGYGTGYPRLC